MIKFICRLINGIIILCIGLITGGFAGMVCQIWAIADDQNYYIGLMKMIKRKSVTVKNAETICKCDEK